MQLSLNSKSTTLESEIRASEDEVVQTSSQGVYERSTGRMSILRLSVFKEVVRDDDQRDLRPRHRGSYAVRYDDRVKD